MNGIEIKQIDSTLKNEIVDLRKVVFKAKYGDAVDVSGLEWNRTDERGIHFGAFKSNRLISVLRLSTLSDPIEFVKLLQFPFDADFCCVPSYCLARAATALDERNQSLNMLLRLKALNYMAQNPGDATFIYGTTLAESQRIQFLKEMGYQILIHQNQWQGYLSSQGKYIAIFRLAMHLVPQAISKLESKIKAIEISEVQI